MTLNLTPRAGMTPQGRNISIVRLMNNLERNGVHTCEFVIQSSGVEGTQPVMSRWRAIREDASDVVFEVFEPQFFVMDFCARIAEGRHERSAGTWRWIIASDQLQTMTT